MEKIAIISDIHGNLEALKSVLLDIEERGITRIFCLGDTIHKGTHSKECLKLVQEKCEVVLRGNCDEQFSKEHDLENMDNEVEKMRIKWNQSILSIEDRNYLLHLPLCYEMYMSGSLIRLFHASPRSLYDYVGIFASIDEKREMFLPTEYTVTQEVADVVIYGHMHTQFMSKEYNKTLINCGSVGNSLDYIRNDEKDGKFLETTNAQYLIIEGEVGSKEYRKPLNFQFVRVPYDIEKELENEHNNPEKDAYRYELTFGKYRDMKKVYQNFEKDGIDISKI